MPRHNIRKVDDIIITHGHADAVLGMDDVRDLQASSVVKVSKDLPLCVVACANPSVDCQSHVCRSCGSPTSKSDSIGFKVDSGPITIYLHDDTMRTVQQQFPYLTQAPPYLDAENFVLERRVALLKFNVIDPNEKFVVHGLPVRSFPVLHGGMYVSLGFAFGKEGEFVYISDVKIIPESTMTYLLSLKIKTLVLDCLDEGPGIFAHIGLVEALDIADKLQPEYLYLVGMGCGMGLHDAVNERLRSMRHQTQLAYDGLVLEGFRI